MATESWRILPAVWLTVAGAAACTPVPERRLDAPLTADSPEVDDKVYGDLIASMLKSGQYYAALAHIQQQRLDDGDNPKLRFFEAEARRNLGQRAAADALYRGLLQTSYAARAYHGLGLLHADVQPDRAIAELREATRRAPTDADFRNDLGYALMRLGRYPEAMREISTAVELAPGSERPRNNLLLLMILQGDEAGVRRVAQTQGVDADTITRLRRQALDLQSRYRAAGGR